MLAKGQCIPAANRGRLFSASRRSGFSVFRRVVNAKFHGFCPSEASDERKMIKMTFPRPRMSEKCEK